MPNSSDLKTITEINLDVNTPGISIIHAKQYDTARKVKAHLFYNGVRWYVPDENIVAVVSYKKADHIGGFYDTTEDGQTAIAIDGEDGSSIYISLDRQLLTTLGNVSVEITFYHSINLSRLSTFSFIVQVEAASLTELDLASNPYFNVLAKDIAAVLDAERNLKDLEATASAVAPGANPTANVTKTENAYKIALGIPSFPGINTNGTSEKLAPGATPTVIVTGGTTASTKYGIEIGVPTFPGFDVPAATGLASDAAPTVTLSGGTKSGSDVTKYHLAFGIPKGEKPVATQITYAYQNSTSGSVIPTGSWTTSASPAKGQYTWCRATTTWDSGGTTITYAVAYNGRDGSGSVDSVNGNVGDVVLTSSNINRSNSTKTVEEELNEKAELIRATNVTLPSGKWAQIPSSDADYASIASSFPYRGTLDSTVNSVFADVKASMFAQVVFGVEDAMNGNYAPITKCAAGKVYIYAMSIPTSSLVIPSVIVFKLEGDQ